MESHSIAPSDSSWPGADGTTRSHKTDMLKVAGRKTYIKRQIVKIRPELLAAYGAQDRGDKPTPASWAHCTVGATNDGEDLDYYLYRLNVIQRCICGWVRNQISRMETRRILL